MTDEIREQLSALVDDELSELEHPLLLGRLQRDAELRECLGRYQLIGEVIRGAGQNATLSVADSVQEALQKDHSITPAGGSGQRHFRHWKPVAGVGIAASVALVAVMTVESMREPVTTSVPELASTATPQSVRRVSDGQWDRIEPRIDKRLSGYLVNHSEYAANRGVQGVMPYVRIVGFQNNQQ